MFIAQIQQIAITKMFETLRIIIIYPINKKRLLFFGLLLIFHLSLIIVFIAENAFIKNLNFHRFPINAKVTLILMLNNILNIPKMIAPHVLILAIELYLFYYAHNLWRCFQVLYCLFVAEGTTVFIFRPLLNTVRAK